MKKFLTSTINYVKMHPKVDLVILALGLAAFVTITLINAPRASIWFDEAFSAYIVQFNFWDIARYTASDVHPPFYYWLLKIWSDLFGTTELAYRSLSIVFGAAASTIAFFLTRKLFGRKVAWVALLLLVVSPMLIRYSDEARMYTLSAVIVMAATYVMLRATETKKRSIWLWYGVLVSLGMWTHYFTALAWIAHWVWRATTIWRKDMAKKEFWRKFFSKEWIIAYALAVGLYLPWIPFMAYQLIVVQSAGFWIGQVSVDTPGNYLSNYFYYLEHNHTFGWWALLLIAITTLVLILIPRVFKALSRAERSSFLLVSIMAWVPPVLLFLASLPPLQSSFVERYVVPSLMFLSVFLAAVLVVGTRGWKPLWRALPIVVIVGMMTFGITNVYFYGNFNKNTNMHILSRQVIDQIHQASPQGAVIVADSPWTFYEAIPYSTEKYPVYFINETTEYRYGSLAMLEDNDMHKIETIAALEKQFKTVWMIGTNETGDIMSPKNVPWTKLQTVSVPDHITDKTLFKATQYQTSAE